jgi:hypothetical protein
VPDVQTAAHTFDGVTQMLPAQQSSLLVHAVFAGMQVSGQNPRAEHARWVVLVSIAQQPEAHWASTVQASAQKSWCAGSPTLARQMPEQQLLGVEVQSELVARQLGPVVPPLPEPLLPPPDPPHEVSTSAAMSTSVFIKLSFVSG